MAAKPVVDGIDKQLEGRVRVIRVDVGSANGKKIAAKAGLDLVPTLIGYDRQGLERFRMTRTPNKIELWRKVVSL
jgi:hypothetical protein